MFYTYYDAPFVRLQLVGGSEGLRSLLFVGGKHQADPLQAWQQSDEPFVEVVEQLDEYFGGERTEFDLRLDPDGTEFQKRVWAVLATIPYGETMSYGEVAARLGNPSAARAVGAANGQNPISIIVPCHRVIGSSGKLVGFGGGLEVKRALLEHERDHVSALSVSRGA